MRPPVTYINDFGTIDIPEWVVDLESFRRWLDSDDFPEKVRIWWLQGRVWIDMSKEQVFSHILVKTKVTMVLARIVEEGQMGLFLGDGLFWSNVHADVGGNPDATFVSNKALESGDARLIEGKKRGYVELEGSPDMVLEVTSDSSVRKDKVTMREAYWEADVREYWLVDARKEPLTFDILRHAAKGYVATRKQDGWIKSAVFGKAFRLTQRVGAHGHREYTLEVQ
jgi:hypothetical protein